MWNWIGLERQQEKDPTTEDEKLEEERISFTFETESFKIGNRNNVVIFGLAAIWYIL